MDVLTSETCWALNKVIIKQVASSLSLFTQQLYIYHMEARWQPVPVAHQFKEYLVLSSVPTTGIFDKYLSLVDICHAPGSKLRYIKLKNT